MTTLAYLRGMTLTDRELAYLILVAEGKTNAEIGAVLYVTEATAKTRIERIIAKLGAVDRSNAVHLGWQYGYLGEAWERRDQQDLLDTVEVVLAEHPDQIDSERPDTVDANLAELAHVWREISGRDLDA